MYHIAVEARLSGPEASKPAAQQMIAEYPEKTLTRPQLQAVLRNEAHIPLERALEKVFMNGHEGVAGGTIIVSGNSKGATVGADDMLSKEMLQPLAQLARRILNATGCTLDIVITQVYGPGPYTVNRVVTHAIHPFPEKRHRTLRVSVLTPTTLGLEA